MNIDINKLKYILNMQLFETEQLIENVLEDSEDDPHYSAVTATNIIKCYIEIMQELEEKIAFDNVESFFKEKGFSGQDYLLFEAKRKKEAEYYCGEQF